MFRLPTLPSNFNHVQIRDRWTAIQNAILPRTGQPWPCINIRNVSSDKKRPYWVLRSALIRKSSEDSHSFLPIGNSAEKRLNEFRRESWRDMRSLLVQFSPPW